LRQSGLLASLLLLETMLSGNISQALSLTEAALQHPITQCLQLVGLNLEGMNISSSETHGELAGVTLAMVTSWQTKEYVLFSMTSQSTQRSDYELINPKKLYLNSSCILLFYIHISMNLNNFS
jgi:hypothetical protein